MIPAILTACALSGFYARTGHCFYTHAPSVAVCEQERTRIEAGMRAAGQIVRFSKCQEERGV